MFEPHFRYEPYLVNILYDIMPQFIVNLLGLLLVRPRRVRVGLEQNKRSAPSMQPRQTTNLVQRAQSQIVHLNPDGTTPIVFALSEQGVLSRQTADSVRRPEPLGVVDKIKNGSEVRRRGLQ
jgi:hypothetical protein